MTKYYQLSHAHFQNRLWRNELEMNQQEVEFFLKIIEELPIESEIFRGAEKKVFINQFHHFQRLIQKLLEEVSKFEKEIASGVLNDNIMDKEQRLDHQYLQEEMDYYEQDYRITKAKFKAFLVSVEEPIID